MEHKAYLSLFEPGNEWISLDKASTAYSPQSVATWQKKLCVCVCVCMCVCSYNKYHMQCQVHYKMLGKIKVMTGETYTGPFQIKFWF